MMSPNRFTTETPSHLRTIRCGLPPLLPFPLDPNYTPDRNPENSDSDDSPSRGQQLWAKQLKEQELMNTANRRIRWILTRLVARVNSLESCACHERDLFPNDHSRGEQNDAYLLTIFDLNRIARKLNGLSCEFDIFLEPRGKLDSTSEEVEDSAYFRYWNENISRRFPDSSVPLCWSAVLALPLEHAASRILALYEVNSDNKSGEGIRNYLQYQAAETLRNIQELELPSVKDRLKQKQTVHHKMQMTQKEFTNRYNKAFEQWDDYCMNVLRVDSDTLPLCPLENEKSLEYHETTTDSYARDIGKCTFEPLRKEFHKLSDRFVKLLTGVTTESSGEHRYYGQSISHGITYYRRFIEFLLSSQDITNHQQSLDRESVVPLETLYQFTTDNGSNDNHHSATCLSQFMNSHAVRAKLVSDLQQLDAFLSCRKREISRTSCRGFGHTLAEAIDMEWAQFCIRNIANQTTEQGIIERLEKVSSDDVIRFQEATRFALTQIVGDGAHAKRLRLIADAVGYTPNDEATSVQSFSWHFNVLCQKAANLSRQMTFFDEQAKRITKAITQLETEIDAIQTEVRALENRIACICDGLKVE